MNESLATKEVLSNLNLRINPKNFNGVYGCMIEFQSDTESIQLRYKQQFEYIGKENQNKHIFRITRLDQIFINDKVPDGLLHELANDISKVLYPLDVECRLTGDYKNVTNFPEIKERWSRKKKWLLNVYKNNDAKKYIESVDSSFEFEERFQAKMRSDFCLSLYFKPIFQYYTAFFMFESTFSFPILGAIKPIHFKVVQSIDEKALQNNDYRIQIKGEIEEERSLADLEQKLDFPNYDGEEKEEKGNCDITYLLNNKTRIVEGINSTFRMNFGNTRKIIIKIFLLE